MIERKLFENIEQNLSQQKVSLLLGARRVGKTELLGKIKAKLGATCLWLNGEDENVAALLKQRSVANYKRLLDGYQLLIIDEAQYIDDIHQKVKLMIDEIKPLHIILTGSSAFDLQQSSEPLVGRSLSYQLYPIAQMELSARENLLETKENLEDRLIFGSYPEVITQPNISDKKEYLQELVNTFLLKDILAFENIKNPQKIKDLLVLISYQIGNEVSSDELGKQLGMSKNTVDRYLDLLTKVFLIYKRTGFSRNLRKEVVKTSRWYFYDNGIRNALINNFSLLAIRQDVGMLWENYICTERIKYNSYHKKNINSYFWRTYDQQEIDLIEESDGQLSAFEMKWKPAKTKQPTAFAKAYPKASFQVITSENYMEYIDA